MTWAQFDATAEKLSGGMGTNKTYGALLHTGGRPFSCPPSSTENTRLSMATTAS